MMFRALFPAFVFAAMVIAGCGGGGGGGALPAASPTPTPHVGPTMVPVPTSSPQVVVLSSSPAPFYTLSFTVPPETNGNTATMSAVLQTTLPSGVNAPQGHSQAKNLVAVKPLASTFQGLAYLVVSTTATVGFSSAPSFQFTVPSGTIPAGQNAYLLYWDPYIGQINGWVNLLGPGTISGTTVTFPGVPTGVQLNANAQYIYALAITTQAIPTATPAPTPTPTVAPSSTPGTVPAYCAGYAAAVANTVSSPQQVRIFDNSGTGAQVVMYLVTGADTNGNHYYLAANGQLTMFSTGAVAPPLPLACFPGSVGNAGSGLMIAIPPPPIGNANMGENLYIALAPSSPSGVLPNPMTFTGNGTAYGGYSLDWNSGSYTGVPFDYVETGLPNATIDTTQVDKVGLPLELTQGSQTVGFGVGQYESLLQAIQTDTDSNTKKLLVSTTLNGRSILARILNPQASDVWGFPQDYFYNPAYAPAGYSDPTRGYLGYVLNQYKSSPRLYQDISNNYFCASYDGTNVLWYSETSASCSNVSGTPYWTMPVATFLEGDAQVDSGICTSAIFAMPWGTGSAMFNGTPTSAFYLWKAMVIEFARGTALAPAPAVHPTGTWTTGTPIASFSSLWPKDPLYSHYWNFVHQNMLGNASYGIAYDEPGGYAPTITANPSQTLTITIQNIPPYSGTNPTTLPSALACPTQ